MHTCNHCGKDETEVKFESRKSGYNKYPYFICKSCHKEYRKQFKDDPSLLRARNERRKPVKKNSRRNPAERDKWIYWDSRKWDRKHGFENDLTRPFIRSLIDRPCVYCGEDKLTMTLDRVDNSVGHLQSNVVGSCVRCNLIRKDMPYSAWLELSESLWHIRCAGLFGAWTGELHK